MHVKRRRLLSNFETCSVALFTSLALYGAPSARAQTAAPTTPATAASASAATSIPPNRWTQEQLSQVFKKSDANSDGKLSREEASLWAGLSRRFDQIDSNKDGSISSAEFDESLK